MKMRTKNMNINASKLSAEAGKIAPTALVTMVNKGGMETVIINADNDKNHKSAYPTYSL
jgi:hypothetical protein